MGGKRVLTEICIPFHLGLLLKERIYFPWRVALIFERFSDTREANSCLQRLPPFAKWLQNVWGVFIHLKQDKPEKYEIFLNAPMPFKTFDGRKPNTVLFDTVFSTFATGKPFRWSSLPWHSAAQVGSAKEPEWNHPILHHLLQCWQRPARSSVELHTTKW